MEKVDERDEAHARREEAERAARASTDPMVVTCPVTGAKRRLASVPPIQGFEHGHPMTLRQWLDDQNAKGQIVDKRDSLHVIGKCAALLARQHEGGMVLGHMLPSRLVISPRGDVSLAPPTPPMSPERSPRGNGSRRRGVRQRRGRSQRRGTSGGEGTSGGKGAGRRSRRRRARGGVQRV